MRVVSLLGLGLMMVVAAGCSSSSGEGDGQDGSGGSSASTGGSNSGSGGSTSGSGGSNSATGGSSNGTGGSSSGSGGGGNVGNSGDPLDQARQACVDRINDFRATLGLPPYQRWVEQEACTDGQAQSDSQTGQAHGAFGDCGENAQNECPGWRSIDQTISGCLQSMWDEGPPPTTPCRGQCFQDHGHFINMSSERYTQVSCGFFETPEGEVWAIQNFR